MGLLDWFRGRKRSSRGTLTSAAQAGEPESQTVPGPDPVAGCPSASSGAPWELKPPRPEDVHPLEGTPLVAFKQGKANVLTDRDSFDYWYGTTRGPDPAQGDLDGLLPSVTRVCVLERGMFRGRAMGGPVLLDERDPGAIRELAGCLRIVEDPRTFGHCACLGGPTLEFYAGFRLVATIGLQHGRAIRWRQWHHDARLQDGQRLTRWLHAQGIAPPRLEAIYGRGMAFFAEDEDDAREPRKSARGLCMKAQESARAGELAKADELCAQALELDADLADAYAIRGRILFHLGRVPEAAASCSAAIDRGNRHAEDYYIRAIAADGDGRTEEALADCELALHLDPDHAGAYNSRAVILIRLGRLDDAVGDLTEAVRLAPGWVLPLFQRAQIHHSKARLDDALADYDRAVELAERVSATAADGDGDGGYMLAQIYCRRGDARYDQFDEEGTEADFAEAYGHRPEVAVSYQGEMWMRRGKYVKALEAFAQLVRLTPEEAGGYIGRGMAEEALGDLEAAEGDYSAAIERRPDGGLGRLARARVYHRLGRNDEALADVSEHLRACPRDEGALLFRAALHRTRGDFAAALEDLNCAQQAAPQNPWTCNNLAWSLATCPDDSLRDGPRAVTLARQACEATGWTHPYCMGTLAAALAETGAFTDAAHWQAQAIDLYPEDEQEAGRARLQLYQDGRPYRE
jgi:tetratricopeptide (TPR) repeat protein